MLSARRLPGSWRSPGNATRRALVLLALAPAACSDGGITAPREGGPTAPGLHEESHIASVLGSLGGGGSNGWAINEAGLGAGWSDVDDGRATWWSATGAAHDVLGLRSAARGINQAGEVVGHFYPATGFQAFVFQAGVRTELEPLEPGRSSAAHGINDAGTVVGTSGPGVRVVVWHRLPDGSYGQPVDIGPGGGAHGPRINGRGDVSWTAAGAEYWPAVALAEPGGGYGPPVWLGRPAGGSHHALGISDAGMVVGFRWSGLVEVAVAWLPGNYDDPVDLGVGQAWAANRHGQIVGTSGGDLPAFGGQPRRPAAWVIEADGSISGPLDIGTPAGYASGGARSISDSGWITGSSWGPDPIRATVWRPKN
jgi:uncharacterized membrane protein